MINWVEMSNLRFIAEFWRNPCQLLGEPRVSVEPRLKYIANKPFKRNGDNSLQAPSFGKVQDFDQLVNWSNCNARLSSNRFILLHETLKNQSEHINNYKWKLQWKTTLPAWRRGQKTDGKAHGWLIGAISYVRCNLYRLKSDRPPLQRILISHCLFGRYDLTVALTLLKTIRNINSFTGHVERFKMAY